MGVLGAGCGVQLSGNEPNPTGRVTWLSRDEILEYTK